MKKTTEKSTDIGFEEWNTLANETVRQVKGLRLQLQIAEGILRQARENRDHLRAQEEEKQPKIDVRPDTATDDVKAHAKQI